MELQKHEFWILQEQNIAINCPEEFKLDVLSLVRGHFKNSKFSNGVH